MSRFRIEHPTDPQRHAYAGHDHAIGFFVEIFREGRDAPIKELDELTLGRPIDLLECLDALASDCFFRDPAHAHLEDALAYIRNGEDRHASEEAMRIVAIIESFTAADADTTE